MITRPYETAASLRVSTLGFCKVGPSSVFICLSQAGIGNFTSPIHAKARKSERYP